MPAVPFEPFLNVLVEGEASVAFDRDVIVVIEQVQLAEAEMPGERRRFGGDSLHEVAVAAESPHPVVDDLVAGAVEPVREEAFGDRHSDGISESLPERPGCDLNT